MSRFSLWTVTAFAMIASAPALSCSGGMMGGGQHGGHGMHAMMHGQGQGMDHGQHMIGQGCGQSGGSCPMAGAAEQTSPVTTGDTNSAHAGHEPEAKK